ncbi:MAG: ornithine cyclodeaminase family protein [Candidatus Acidiferrales bacterium]
MKRLLAPAQAVTLLEAAFARDYRATAAVPVRAQFEIPSLGVLLFMPCHDRALPALGLKLVTVQEQPQPGSEHVQAIYLLLDPETGQLKALMAANALTDLRTAATSAVATKYLARSEAKTLGVFGTGRQARAHLTVLPAVRPFERVLVCGSSPARSQEFVRRFAGECACPLEPAEPRRLVEQSEVICTCTTAREPLFDGRWLRPGIHLNLVGAFQPATREVDDETVRRARVVVDTYEGALAEAGDLLIPLGRGVVTRQHIVADLHEIVSGSKPGRTAAEEITIFKSVGCALEDLVTAAFVYDEAVRQGLL